MKLTEEDRSCEEKGSKCNRAVDFTQLEAKQISKIKDEDVWMLDLLKHNMDCWKCDFLKIFLV